MKRILTLATIVCLVGCASSTQKEKVSDRSLDSLVLIPDTSSPEISGPISTSSWNYQEEEDKMTSKTDFFASVNAKDLLQFDFPYDGGVTATFVIRKSAKYGLDTYLKVSEGQFHGDYNSPTVLIRFDDTPAKTYSYSKASDGSSDIIFINGSASLISKIKKAHTMLVEAEFYNNGRRQMEFDVHDLNWKH